MIEKIVSIIKNIVGTILLIIPLYIIYKQLKDIKKSYFKELKNEEIIELKKIANAENYKIYETNLPILRFNALSLGRIILISKDFIEKGGACLKGTILHEIGHTKRKHFIIALIYFAPILYTYYSSISLLLKAIIIALGIILYIRIGHEFQKQADEFAFNLIGEDAISPLQFLYENKDGSMRNSITKYFVNFILFLKFSPSKDLEDRISHLKLLLSKRSKKVR